MCCLLVCLFFFHFSTSPLDDSCNDEVNNQSQRIDDYVSERPESGNMRSESYKKINKSINMILFVIFNT